MRQVTPNEGLPIENWAKAYLAHDLDFAAIEHLHLFHRLEFAVALIGADFEDAALFVARICRLLYSGHSGKSKHKPAVDAFEARIGFRRLHVVLRRRIQPGERLKA